MTTADGSRPVTLGTAKIGSDGPADTTYHISLKLAGPDISIAVDGGRLGSPVELFARDETFSRGKAGLYCCMSRLVSFDNLAGALARSIPDPQGKRRVDLRKHERRRIRHPERQRA
jgi:hypothetical protein